MVTLHTITIIHERLPGVLLSAFRYEHNTKIALVCNEISGPMLSVLGGCLRTNEMPLLLRKKDIERGRDVFALDFLHMSTDYTMIAGEDVFKDMIIDRDDVRRNLEYELRSRLIRLYNVLSVSTSTKDRKNIIAYTPSALLPVLKGILYLKQTTIPADHEQLLHAIEQTYHIETALLAKIFKKHALHRDVDDLLLWLTSICDRIDTITA